MIEFREYVTNSAKTKDSQKERLSIQERATVHIASPLVEKMGSHSIEKMLNTFKDNGIVLLQLEVPERPSIVHENLLGLTKYFGLFEQHKHSRKGIVDITTTPGIYENDGIRRPQSDSGKQSPHTDGACTIPPEILGLGCFRPAAQGGESIFVDMQSAHKFLSEENPNALKTLYHPEAGTVIRGDKSRSGAIFTNRNDRVIATYSNHEYNEVVVSLNVEKDLICLIAM